MLHVWKRKFILECLFEAYFYKKSGYWFFLSASWEHMTTLFLSCNFLYSRFFSPVIVLKQPLHTHKHTHTHTNTHFCPPMSLLLTRELDNGREGQLSVCVCVCVCVCVLACVCVYFFKMMTDQARKLSPQVSLLYLKSNIRSRVPKKCINDLCL